MQIDATEQPTPRSAEWLAGWDAGRAQEFKFASQVTRYRSQTDVAQGERDQLRAVAKATRDTLTVIDEWLGMASTREAAIDSMRRLERLLSAVGFEYTWKGILDWRGSLIDELWQACFYVGPDGHWHYVPGGPPPVFGNADGPQLAEIVSVMENALRDRAAMALELQNARELLEDVWQQFAVPGKDGKLWAGGLSTLEAVDRALHEKGVGNG